MEDILFPPNALYYIFATLIVTLGVFLIGVVLEKYIKQFSIPSRWIAFTFLVSALFVYWLFQSTEAIPTTKVNQTLEAQGTQTVFEARQTWEVEIFPIVKASLDPLKGGTITFIGSRTNNISPSHRFSFVNGQMEPENVPSDFTFSDCKVFELAIYCAASARGFWRLGNISLDEIENKPSSIPETSTVSMTLSEGTSYVVETENGNLAKFRILNPRTDGTDGGYQFSLEWIYQPNKRDDFLGG